MLMQNFGVTNKEHYGMLWYFLEWSITCKFASVKTDAYCMIRVSDPAMHCGKRLLSPFVSRKFNTLLF